MCLLPRRLALGIVVWFGFNTGGVAQLPSVTPVAPLTGRVIPCDQGKAKHFECHNVELLAFLPNTAIGGARTFDVWGWTDSVTGKEFVLIGGENGTAFVEITDPVTPRYLGLLPPHSGKTAMGDYSVKVYQHHAFMGYESGQGLQVFDLTQLRDVQTLPVTFQETAHYGDFSRTHTIAINSETGVLYANGSNTCGSGLHMVDVRTPTKPAFAGCYSEPKIRGVPSNGYVHDTHCILYKGPDQRYKGREICASSMGSAVGIADVTDKQQSKTLSMATYPNAAYAHQGWFSEDHRYFFLADEFYGAVNSFQASMTMPWAKPDTASGTKRQIPTFVFDVTDLDDPILLTEYLADRPHNLYIRGRYMYQATFGKGLQIVDVADPKQPTEVGYLATGAAWSLYPYFKSETVAVSTGTGLFLARLKK